MEKDRGEQTGKLPNMWRLNNVLLNNMGQNKSQGKFNNILT